MRRMSLLVLAALVLAGCADERAADRAGATSEPAARGGAKEAARDPAPPASTDADAASGASPTSAPAGPVPSAPAGGASPPAPNGDPNLARFSGYGDIPFGTPVADMARLWGGELRTLGKEFNDRCYFLVPVWAKRPADFSLMVSEGRFVRFSTERDAFIAPGGARVGLTKAEVIRLHAGRVDVQPHKYSDGQYLRVRDPAGGRGVLILETDGKGDDARVTEWRIGVPPEVDFVEGCA